MRGIKIKAIKASGGDWMRESVRQISGFGFGGTIGIGIGRGTFAVGTLLAAKTGLLVAGPLGWLVLGGIFAASLGAGYLAGGRGDQLGQWFSNGIMKGSFNDPS